MNYELICSWLGLPQGCWPPDHYTLLGVERGSLDPERMERQVHERMERVRHYQLTHPELATEAMNRLAQALVCLTDPAARQAYDTVFFPAQTAAAGGGGEPALPPIRRLASAPIASEGLGGTAQQVFLPAAPPQRIHWEIAPPPPQRTRPEDTLSLPTAAVDTVDESMVNHPPLSAPSAESAEAVISPSGGGEAVFSPRLTGEEQGGVPENLLVVTASIAQGEEPMPAAVRVPGLARRGLGTKRALYYRIARTRQLLWAWERVGAYLREPGRPLTRTTEISDLMRQLRLIRELLQAFPPLLGEAGQPGYRVMALARQPLSLPAFQSMLISQPRELLARDWQAGFALLEEHRRFLRDELRCLRRRNAIGRSLRTLRTGIVDNPGTLLVAVAAAALNLAYPPLRDKWPEQAIVLSALAALKGYLWWDAVEQARPVRIVRRIVPARSAARRPNAQPPLNR